MIFFKKQYQPNNKIETCKSVSLILALTIVLSLVSCSKNIKYTSEHMEQTSGRYLYDEDNIIDVFYENEKLFLNLGGVKTLEPVVLDEQTFFIADLYKKLRFAQHPETKKRYLSIVSEDNEDLVSYDYLKVDDTYKTPRMHLEDGNFNEALKGYLEIQAQNSTNAMIDEGDLNRLGYQLLRKKEYENAIDVFKMNVTLYPESGNVYDSLADAYLAHGDSLQAYENFRKTLEYNEHNSKAKRFVADYKEKND